jgi:hypothetical protein
MPHPEHGWREYAPPRTSLLASRTPELPHVVMRSARERKSPNRQGLLSGGGVGFGWTSAMADSFVEARELG